MTKTQEAPVVSQSSPEEQFRLAHEDLSRRGCQPNYVRVPYGNIVATILADPNSTWVVVSAEVDAPLATGGRGAIRWLLERIKRAPQDLVIEAYADNADTPKMASKIDAEQDASLLLDEYVGIERFRILLCRNGSEAQSGESESLGFVESVNMVFNEFYRQALYPLTARTPTVSRGKLQKVDNALAKSKSHPLRRATDRKPVAPFAAHQVG